MNELVEWLRGVLDDDERESKQATPGPWAASGHSVITTDDIEIADVPRRDATHIARHDPAAVLADIEAKKAVLDLLNLTTGLYDPATGVLNEVVHALARAYRHRPGWKREWE